MSAAADTGAIVARFAARLERAREAAPVALRQLRWLLDDIGTEHLEKCPRFEVCATCSNIRSAMLTLMVVDGEP